MKLPALLLALGLLGVGCCGPSPEEAVLIDDEIAHLGSAAQTPGPRDAAEIARINSKTQAIQKRWKGAR